MAKRLHETVRVIEVAGQLHVTGRIHVAPRLAEVNRRIAKMDNRLYVVELPHEAAGRRSTMAT